MIEAGVRVRTLVDLVTTDSEVIEEGRFGTVIGYEGEKLIVEFHDQETDTRGTVLAERWEVRR